MFRTAIDSAWGITALVFIGLGTAIAAEGSADAAGDRVLRLRAAAVNTAVEPGLLRVPPTAFDEHRRYVVQLDGPLSPERRARLKAAGVALGDYLPVHAYIARLNRVDPAALSAMDFVQWVGVYRNEWKLDPQIGQRRPAALAKDEFAAPRYTGPVSSKRVRLVVTAFEDTEADVATDELTTAGATVVAANSTPRNLRIDVAMSLGDVPRLASLDWVQFVEEAPQAVLRNDTNEWIVQSNASGYTPVWDRGIHGEGQVGGLIDGPVAESHCSFNDDVPIGPDHRKIIGYRGLMDSNSHGTHTAGTFVGDQGAWDEPDFRDGLAFAATLSFSSLWDIIDAPSTLLPRLMDAHADGARVHSNSWGDDGTTTYTTWCQQIDEFSRLNEDSLVVFAVTNQGTLRTPENAKNVLAVGATFDAPDQDQHFSGGTGPTSDGRRKPEVYAPGAGTQSSRSGTSCSWISMSGTSMACPAVSGAGLLVRQYFTDGLYPTGWPVPADARIPTGAFIKAVLINSAVDMAGVHGYPSDLEGWGRILIDGPLYFSGDTSLLFVDDLRNAEGLNTGESRLYPIRVADASVPLRVTLVWTDVPATVAASFAPVNDLDLEVQAPDTALYRGNVFDTSLGRSIPGGARDDRNNVEQVHLPAPTPGLYQIEVIATEVNAERQGYALVITGAIADATADCNGNGTPDYQDIDGGASEDCNGNNIPDECEGDFDNDGLIDACDLDIDNDGVPNENDECDNTPPGMPVRPNGSPFGDVDSDCDVDLSDYSFFDDCILQGGPGPSAPGPDCREAFDADGDEDVDLADFAVLQLGFSG